MLVLYPKPACLIQQFKEEKQKQNKNHFLKQQMKSYVNSYIKNRYEQMWYDQSVSRSTEPYQLIDHCVFLLFFFF